MLKGAIRQDKSTQDWAKLSHSYALKVQDSDDSEAKIAKPAKNPLQMPDRWLMSSSSNFSYQDFRQGSTRK